MTEKKKMGRPPGSPDYANKEEIKVQLTSWMSEGKTLREFCRKEEMPVYATIYDWLEEDAEFSARFARARDMGHDAIAEDALRIADSIFTGKKVVKQTGGQVEPQKIWRKNDRFRRCRRALGGSGRLRHLWRTD